MSVAASTAVSPALAVPWRHAAVDLPALPASAPAARQLLRLVLASWETTTHADTAELITSELVTNAITASEAAGCALVRVRLTARADSLRIGVWDHGAPFPAQRAAGRVDDLGGRGLVIVDALADAWGVEPGRDGGKVVYAVLGCGRRHAPHIGQASGPGPARSGATPLAEPRAEQSRTCRLSLACAASRAMNIPRRARFLIIWPVPGERYGPGSPRNGGVMAARIDLTLDCATQPGLRRSGSWRSAMRMSRRPPRMPPAMNGFASTAIPVTPRTTAPGCMTRPALVPGFPCCACPSRRPPRTGCT